MIKLAEREINFSSCYYSSENTIFPICIACRLELREILARHESSVLFTNDDQFFTIAALSIAKQSSKTILFFLSSFSQVVYRSALPVNGCQRRDDTAVFDAVDIVAAWLALNGTLRV